MISNLLLMLGISMQPCGIDNVYVCVEWDVLPYSKGFHFVPVVHILCIKVQHWFCMDMEEQYIGMCCMFHKTQASTFP